MAYNNHNHDHDNHTPTVAGGVDVSALDRHARSRYEFNRAIVEAVRGGEPVASVADRHGVTRQWVYRLERRWREQGDAGLVPRKRAARRVANRTGESVRREVVRLRGWLKDNGMDAGARSIRDRLEGQGLPVPAASTIHRILVSEGLVQAEPAKRPHASLVRFEADLPNETWQADFTHWPLADGTDAQVLTWIDDHSRMVMACRAYAPVRVEDVAALFLAACHEHGIPASTLTDNGSVFRTVPGSGQRHHRFEALLAQLGVEQKNGRPFHPQTQGKIERWHRTLKQWLAAQPLAAGLDELNGQLARFIRYYNHERRHSAIGRRTPWQAYTERDKARPDARLAAAVEEAEAAMREPDARPRRRARIGLHARHGASCPRLLQADGLTVGANGVLSTPRIGARRAKLGLGCAWAGRTVDLLVRDGMVTVIDPPTGEIVFGQRLDPTRDYQPRHR